jgi:hypothetical protein
MEKALSNVTPSVEVRSRRTGVPPSRFREVRPDRKTPQHQMADSLQQGKKRQAYRRNTNEIMAASKGEGGIEEKKIRTRWLKPTRLSATSEFNTQEHVVTAPELQHLPKLTEQTHHNILLLELAGSFINELTINRIGYWLFFPS